MLTHTPWLEVLAGLLLFVVFAWGFIWFIGEGIIVPLARRIRYRLAARQLRRYWREHPHGPIEQWEAQRRG